jgi:hypothetical protein
MFDRRFLLIPFASRNVLLTEADGFETPRIAGVERVIGYSDFYVFGIRVARLQRTEPWTQATLDLMARG